jgi:hypothetical protein
MGGISVPNLFHQPPATKKIVFGTFTQCKKTGNVDKRGNNFPTIEHKMWIKSMQNLDL